MFLTFCFCISRAYLTIIEQNWLYISEYISNTEYLTVLESSRVHYLGRMVYLSCKKCLILIQHLEGQVGVRLPHARGTEENPSVRRRPAIRWQSSTTLNIRSSICVQVSVYDGEATDFVEKQTCLILRIFCLICR